MRDVIIGVVLVALFIGAILFMDGPAPGQVQVGGGVAIVPGGLVGPSGSQGPTGSPGPAGTPQLASPTAISALPSCTAAIEGQMAQIDNQQNTPVWAQTPVATATAGIKCGVFCNGANWTVFSR